MSAHREPLVDVDNATAWELIVEDEARWQAWSAQIDNRLPYRDAAVRSLLAAAERIVAALDECT